MSQLSGLTQVQCQKKGGNLGKWWWTNPTKDEPPSRRCLMVVKIYPIEYPFCRRWLQKNTMLPGKPKRRTARAARGDLEMKRWNFNGGGVVPPPIGHTIEIHKEIGTYWRNAHCYLGGSRWAVCWSTELKMGNPPFCKWFFYRPDLWARIWIKAPLWES